MSQNQIAQTALARFGGVVFLNEDGHGNLRIINSPGSYETVAASQTKQALGATGAVGDTLASVTIVPATTSPGAVTAYDSASGSAIALFTGGATSVSNLQPFTIPLGMVSLAGAWCITTGTNVSVVAVGDFT